MLPSEFIRQKREGEKHRQDDLKSFILQYTRGEIPDENMAAWLMAAFLRGLDANETSVLTEVMLQSGKSFDWKHLGRPTADKHSTGGVGDKTSLLIAGMVSACGVGVPMISGRGLGHTGGTLDKLESIPGFRTQIGETEAKALMKKNLCVLMGQTPEICPADRKLYALRDTTATVESIPLITASIMSKKLAEGTGALCFDVKFGSGAFMVLVEQARQLARSLLGVARNFGVPASALLSSMNQPLGPFAGNACEVRECLSIYEGSSDEKLSPTRHLSIELSAQMLQLSGAAQDLNQARIEAEEALRSGRAYEQFQRIVSSQGGQLRQLPQASQKKALIATRSGFLRTIETSQLGLALIELGAGRKLKSDPVDPSAGLEIHKKLGDFVSAGEPLVTLMSSQITDFSSAENRLRRAFEIQEHPNPRAESLILEILYAQQDGADLYSQ
ncbi:MAG: thymidine phosphorylase [Bdellovibrio sp.]